MPIRPVTECPCPRWIRRRSRPSRPSPMFQAAMTKVREEKFIAYLTLRMPKSHWFWTNMSLKGETDGADRDHGPLYNHWVDVSSWFCCYFTKDLLCKGRAGFFWPLSRANRRI